MANAAMTVDILIIGILLCHFVVQSVVSVANQRRAHPQDVV